MTEVPDKGEFLVRNGVGYPVMELSSTDHTDEYWAYDLYTYVDDEGEEVIL